MPAEAAELDRASQERGISVETLMENAGRAVAEAGVRLAGGRYGKRAVVVCGKGNNGGDGLVAARYLDAWGSRVTVLLLDRRDAFREPAATNLTRLERSNVRVRPWSRLPTSGSRTTSYTAMSGSSRTQTSPFGSPRARPKRTSAQRAMRS